jgi:Planctomycete cytochrome C
MSSRRTLQTLMLKRLTRPSSRLLSVLVLWCAPGWAERMRTLPPPAHIHVEFGLDIEPLFRGRCYNCHGPQEQKGGLRLDIKTAALAGGNSGAVIKPGNSAGSRLIQLVAGLDDPPMPLIGEKLSPDQIGLLRAWIDQGAAWPENDSTASEPNGLSKPTAQDGENQKAKGTH